VWLASGASASQAEAAERWKAPFGGAFSADFTVASDYSFAGISQTKRAPAYQVGLDYRTPEVGTEVPLWLYLRGWGSNIDFPTTGPGIEVDLSGGLKARALKDKLAVDVGYIRYFYPGSPPNFAYEYGELSLNIEYDFGVASLAGRVRFSPNSFGSSGNSLNKRGLLSVPLSFLDIGDVSVKAYGSVGNFWVDRFLAYGVPSNDYWYWQIGLVASAHGVDVMAAYTDTSIDPAGCSFTNYCAGRFFVSITKTF
jgi:uncharacterized protein (TIGR02001 family)